MPNPYQPPREVNEPAQPTDNPIKSRPTAKWVRMFLAIWGAFLVYLGYEGLREGRTIIGVMVLLTGAAFVVENAFRPFFKPK